MEFQSPCLVERSPIHSRKLRVAEFDTRTADVLVEFRLALETLLNLPALSRPSWSSFLVVLHVPGCSTERTSSKCGGTKCRGIKCRRTKCRGTKCRGLSVGD